MHEELASTVPEETRARNQKRKVDPLRGKSLKTKRLDSFEEKNDESEVRFTMNVSSEYLKYRLVPKRSLRCSSSFRTSKMFLKVLEKCCSFEGKNDKSEYHLGVTRSCTGTKRKF
jgi:hypothetical protein